MDLLSMVNQQDAIQITLMSKKPVNTFQIPPIASSKGHKAEDWRGKQIWTGYCRVMMENSKKCLVQLLNEDNSMFAQSVIEDENYESYVQRCFDSSRFFALMLVSDQGQKALIGIGFPERNDSFDFIVALDEFKKQLRQEKGLDKPNVQAQNKDYSLKEGEKTTLNIQGLKKTNQNPIQSKPSGGGLKKLAPPPGVKSQYQKPQEFDPFTQQNNSQQEKNTNLLDQLGDFTDFQNSNQNQSNNNTGGSSLLDF